MPPVLAALGAFLGTTSLGATLAATTGLAAGGLGLGEGIKNIVDPPTPPTSPASPASTLTPPGGPSIPQIGAAQSAGANLEAAASGGLSPGTLPQLLALLDTSGQGFGGGAQQASNNIFGTPG